MSGSKSLNNRERRRHQSINRYHRKRAEKYGGNARGISRIEWTQLCERFSNRCAYCLKSKYLTIEHVDPLSAGGAHHPDNIVPACLDCNKSKLSMKLLQWLIKRPCVSVEPSTS